MDFKAFLLNEVRAHVLSQNPTKLIAFQANTWLVGEDTDAQRLQNIATIIYKLHGQGEAQGGRAIGSPQVVSLQALLSWTKNIGDVVTANWDHAKGTFKNAYAGRKPMSPTSPLIPKVIKALAKVGIQAKPVFDQAPGQGQPQMGEAQVIYHGTSSDNLPTILKYGLQPKPSKHWDVSHQSHVFVAATFDEAAGHAKNAAMHRKIKEDVHLKPVVIGFKVADKAKLDADYDVHLGATHDKNRPDPFQTEADTTQNWFSTDAAKASKHVGTFSHLGRIAPQHIVSVHVQENNQWRQMSAQEIARYKGAARQETPNQFVYASPQRKKPQQAKSTGRPSEWEWPIDDEPQPVAAKPVAPQQQKGGFMNWMRKKFSRS